MHSKKEEQSRSKAKSLLVVALLVLLVHFTCTVLHTMPGFPAPAWLKVQARYYMEPMFHQGWMLFAPDVKNYNAQISYRIPEAGGWSDWKTTDSLEPVADHSRVKYVGRKVALKLVNTMNSDQMGVYYVDDVPQYDKVVTTGDYQRALYLVYKQNEIITGQLVDSIQLKLDVWFVPDFKTGKVPYEDLNFTFPVKEINDYRKN
jgi:hypothetical protein